MKHAEELIAAITPEHFPPDMYLAGGLLPVHSLVMTEARMLRRVIAWMREAELPKATEDKLTAYCARRKIERDGRVLQRRTAILEIITACLDNESVALDMPTYNDIVERVRRLEALVSKEAGQ